MSCRKPCARNVLWKQLETPKTSESDFSVSNKMFRCIIFVTICSSSFEFPEKKQRCQLQHLYIHVPMYLGAYYNIFVHSIFKYKYMLSMFIYLEKKESKSTARRAQSTHFVFNRQLHARKRRNASSKQVQKSPKNI